MVARQPRRRKSHRPTRYISFPPFELILRALEADLGLAPVEKSVQNRISLRIGVAVRKIAAVGTAARGGACGGVPAGGHLGWITFFNTVILTYYTHIFDELGK